MEHDNIIPVIVNGIPLEQTLSPVKFPFFSRSEMKAFGDHCRVVMNGRYSDQAMDALLDTWIQNNKT